MKKYFLSSVAFVFFLAIFFIVATYENTAFAAKIIPQGQRCYQSQGCGTSTEVCVPDGKMCGVMIQTSCGTGVCRTTTATGGSCDPNGSVCDSSKGYTCLQSKCTQSSVGTQSCSYTCQKQTVGAGKNCTGNGQGNCQSGYVCLTNSSKCSGVGITRYCQTTCQKQQTKGSCDPNNDKCASGTTCLLAPGSSNSCGSAIPVQGANCNYTCQAQKKSGSCTPNSQMCASGYECVLEKGSSNSCGSAIPQPGQKCTYSCQSPQSPTGVPTLPPPPSPPCAAWSNGQCQTFDTTLGAFSTDPSGFIAKIFAVLLSVSGGIAALLIIKAGYQLMTSQGKPEQMQAGRDQLIAAIVGLVFLIFSFALLEIIGFDILHIPGFNGAGGTTGGNGAAGASVQSCKAAGLQFCTKTQQCQPLGTICP